MEIIDELEPVKRGVYAGAVGYLGFHGNMDVAIALRTAVVKDGKLHVQAGGGIVADSQPAAEWQERRARRGRSCARRRWPKAGWILASSEQRRNGCAAKFD
jgi:anthranilate/para-aminobenzoate synthase component I